MSTAAPHPPPPARAAAVEAAGGAGIPAPSPRAQRQPISTGADRGGTRSTSAARKWLLACLTVVAACAAGVAGFLAGGFQFQGIAGWRAAEPATPAALQNLRRALSEHAWHTLDAGAVQWQVRLDDSERRVELALHGRILGQTRAALDAFAASFPAHIRSLCDDGRNRPGADEAVMIEHRGKLLREAEQLSAASQAPDDGLQYQQALTHQQDRMSSLREVVGRQHEAVAAAERELLALASPPTASEAVVDPRVREQAVAAEVELQQDLKALHVQLAEMRKLLLDVHGAASPPLKELKSAAGELVNVLAGDAARSSEGGLAAAIELTAESAADYDALLVTFARAWDEEFAALEALDDDPRRAEAIALAQRIADQVNAFLFQSGPPLAAMREQLKAVGDDPDAQARYHALVSSLTRAFHLFQTAHHRFEFLAGDVKPTQNFRLDAALKSAQGLRRRSQESLRALETRLAAQALADLRTERERRKIELETSLVALRAELHASLEALLAAHDQGEAARPDVERLLRSAAGQEWNRGRRLEIERELADIDMRLTEMAAQRLAALPPADLEPVACGVDPRPVNLAAKLVQGGLSAVLALVILTATLLRGRNE